MDYKNPTPVAVNVVFVKKNDNTLGVLGVERAIEPFIGGLAMPGGFVNEMETIEQGAAREFEEECGMRTDASKWVLTESKITPNNRVLIFTTLDEYISESDVQKMQPNDEVKSFVILDKSSKLCFSLHQEILDSIFMSHWDWDDWEPNKDNSFASILTRGSNFIKQFFVIE